MSELVDHLAELTGHRDRDVLDVTLVSALRDMLRTRSISIYRSVGEPGQERWITRARLVGNDAVPEADSAWSGLDELPSLCSYPARLAVLREERVLEVRAATCQTLFPLSTEREVVGVLEIETDAGLDAQQQRTVTGVLKIFRNFQGLLDYSERDSLTGLLNRKTFDESFLKASAESGAGTGASMEGQRFVGDGCTHWLGVIDIDHFKRVNDSYGHLIGDEVLLLLSRLMRGTLRARDRLYRFGGEEFVALLRCNGPEAAWLAFERLRANAERYLFPQVEHITLSIGFTEVRLGDTPGAAFERADKAVYYAKAHGRNQIQLHEALVRRGELEDALKVSDIEMF